MTRSNSVSMQADYTRRRFVKLGLGFAGLAVFDCGLGSTSGLFRLVSQAEADDGSSGSGSGSSGSGSGSGSSAKRPF